ncbi:MAG TPA: CmcJ/NvfI family oxidoreductase [Polyangiales bacterium]|nr:CmcJ/NvfI family oxidoreductase [Polyangiales bacterium]
MATATEDFVEADLNYLAYDGRRPVNYAYPPPAGIPQSNVTFVPHHVRIENGRALGERPSLHRQGFELREHRSAVQDFSEETVIRELALCDARSISRDDLIASDLVYRDKVGETYAFRHNPNHRWFYFPEVRPDEVVLLKIYDSLVTGAARLTAHTAFDHPNTLPNAAPRRSIELRTLVFWPATRGAE